MTDSTDREVHRGLRSDNRPGSALCPPLLIDAVLAPGDAPYLPRDWLHAATARGQAAAHLTDGRAAGEDHTEAQIFR